MSDGVRKGSDCSGKFQMMSKICPEVVVGCQEYFGKVFFGFWKALDGVRKVSCVVRNVSECYRKV